jgi:hypothetical protein
VWFTKKTDAAGSGEPPPKLSELLAAPGDAVPVHLADGAAASQSPQPAPVEPASVSVSASAPAPVAIRNGLVDDDPQYRMPLI